LFKDGVLVRAAALRGPTTGRGPAVWSAYAGLVVDWLAKSIVTRTHLFTPGPDGTLVVETMRHNPTRSVPVEDLLELAGVAGAIVGKLAGWDAHAALAHKWKGQVPREIMGNRVADHLRAEGLWSCVEVPSRATELNDAMHAVGLGRWYLAR
jgi:hypothetical protein